MDDIYWANKKSHECAEECMNKTENYYNVVMNNGMAALWSRTSTYYNQAFYTSGTLNRGGDYGEFTVMNVNHFRNILQHVLTMTIGQRPSFEPRAVNTDKKTQAQTMLARGLLDYYMRQQRLERYLKTAVEYALLFGEGFMEAVWDSTLGEVYSVSEGGEEYKQGDLRYTALEPIDVIRESASETHFDNKWYILRKLVNKYDLAAKFGTVTDDMDDETKEKTIRIRENILQQTLQYDPRTQVRKFSRDFYESDLIYMYVMYHDRTPSLPKGRMMEYIDDQTVLSDQPLAYKGLPVYRCSAGEFTSTTFGYTMAYDLLVVQEYIDGLMSTIATAQETYGVQNVLYPMGANITLEHLSSGLNGIPYDPSIPGGPASIQVLNLLQTPAELFKFLNDCERLMETLSGVNSVARGNPESSLKSGAALALVQSMAVQFSQALQSSYVQLLEDVGTATVDLLKNYANTPRLALIAGKSNRSELAEFTGEDLTEVRRVQVDIGNPMTRTTAGKTQLAEWMIQMNQIDTPDQLLQVLETGNLEVLTEGRTTELMAIKEENERLSEGKEVVVMPTDMHSTHITEHKAVLADPAMRHDPKIVQAVLAHLLEHVKVLQDPNYRELLAIMGQQPLQPAQPTQEALGQVPPTQGQSIPVGANELAASNQPNLPKMPKNPMTGQRAPAPAGTVAQGAANVQR